MKFKTICFIVVPLIFFGCGAYHYMQRPEEGNAQNMPKNKEDLQKRIEELHGSKR